MSNDNQIEQHLKGLGRERLRIFFIVSKGKPTDITFTAHLD